MRSERVALLAAFFAGLALIAAASPARAQATAARLDVDAQPSCSTRDELIARVASRSARIRFVADGTGVPTLSARIEVGPRGGVVAELAVVEPDGRRLARRLQAPSCAAATDALALVIAITLDPTVTGAEPSGTGASPAASSEAPPAAAPPAPTPPPIPPAAEVARSDEIGPADATDVASTRRLGLGAGATAATGPAPTVMPGIAVEVLGGLDRASIWSPALAVSFAHLWSTPSRPPGGTAEFTLDVVALDACPLRVVLAKVEARACAMGALGRLAARGSDTFDASSVARPFAAAGGAARLVVPLGARLVLAARFAAAAPLWRDAFQFDPKVFHRVASVTLIGELGLGVRFP